MPAKTLFVVTHTEAVHHVEHRVGGWYDTVLTEAGRCAAKKIAAHLKAQIGDRDVELYSSDLLRASQTAEPTAHALGVKIDLMPDLREMHYGWRKESLRSGCERGKLRPRTTTDWIIGAISRRLRRDENLQRASIAPWTPSWLNPVRLKSSSRMASCPLLSWLLGLECRSNPPDTSTCASAPEALRICAKTNSGGAVRSFH